MDFGYLPKALSVLTVIFDGSAIELERPASDVLTLKLGAPHAGAHTFNYKAALQLSDGSDDDDDGTAQWAAGVDVFPEGDVLDLQPVQLVEHFKEVFC